MSFLDRLLRGARERIDLPTLPVAPALPVIKPLETPLPTQIGGIGSMLPMQTITLPGGQTVQIPEINMEEVNANLAAAGITPQVPTPTVVPETQDLTISPLDETLTNPRGDFMSIERMPQDITPVSPVPAPVVESPVFAGGSGGALPVDEFMPRTFPDLPITNFPIDIPPDAPPPAPAVTTPAPQFRTADFQDADGNGIDDRDEMNTNPNLATTLPDLPGTGSLVTPPAEQLAPYTGAQASPEDMPFVPSVRQVATGLDPLTEQLLFGLGGEGGFIPGAMQAAEKVFFDEEGKPIVIEEQVAGFSPDQLRAQELARQGVGIQDRFISGAEGAFGQGIDALRSGFGRARGLAGEGLEATRAGVGQLQRGLGESADILRGTIGGYDQAMTDRFYNPFEDRVVQQTIDDIMEAGAKRDIAARAGDIGRGGESAFGSRARLGASERQESLGRGLAEALGGIRARGFSEAQQTGLGEFARQRAAERAAASGLAGLTGQGFGGQQALAGALTGLGGIEQQLARQQQGAQFGLGTALQGLGAQAQGASASDVASLYGMGTQQQAFNQAQLDAQRRNQLQAQQAPLAQYQALAPFVSMAPAGQFQTVTDFAPPPSPLQAGLGVGLSTFGALGNLYGGQG